MSNTNTVRIPGTDTYVKVAPKPEPETYYVVIGSDGEPVVGATPGKALAAARAAGAANWNEPVVVYETDADTAGNALMRALATRDVNDDADDIIELEANPLFTRTEPCELDDITPRDLGLDHPAWVEADASVARCLSIVQGGCASGAYLEAVTYAEALRVMNEHGDDVLQYIEDNLGHDALRPDLTGLSWGEVASHFLAQAVELWASYVTGALEQ